MLEYPDLAMSRVGLLVSYIVFLPHLVFQSRPLASYHGNFSPERQLVLLLQEQPELQKMHHPE